MVRTTLEWRAYEAHNQISGRSRPEVPGLRSFGACLAHPDIRLGRQDMWTSESLKAARPWIGRLGPAILMLVAGIVLWRELGHLKPADIGAEILAWGPFRVGAAVLLTLVSFALLAGLEWLGLSWAGARVPFGQVLLGSFCANAFAHVIGFAVFIGGAIRARLYARSGASLMAVAQTSVFCAFGFGLGLMLLAGMALLVEPSPPIAGLQLHPGLGAGLGALLTLVPLAYIAACAMIRRPITIAGNTMALPPPLAATAQVVLGLADNLATAVVVWLLLPQSGSLAAFAGPYAVATAAGVVSSVPAGAGVFEGTLLTLLPGMSRAVLAAALLGYRVIYYVIPLVVAVVVLAQTGLGQELSYDRGRRLVRRFAPPLLAAGALIQGVTLILTGIGRIDPARLAILRSTVSPAVLETSHLLCLISGLALMAVCLPLFRRHASAVPVAVAAALAGASTSLLRGLDIGPAATALLLAFLIILARRAFHRRGNWPVSQMLPWWLIGAAAVLVGGLVLGLWIYDDTPYEARLWAQVGYHADPGRFLRSLAVVGAALLAAGAWALARVSRPSAAPAGTAELSLITPLVEASPDTLARLALTGDKAILLADQGEAFIMYGAEGRSLIAMGDPVGDPAGARDLLWRFKELASLRDARPVIYQASPRWLTAYLDLGLSLLKLGEEARIRLEGFDLQGARRAKLRQGYARAKREGLTFEVHLAPHAPQLLDDLQVISDSWLIERGGREKGFSVGRFDRDALSREPVALVRQNARVVAFANIWTGGREEASIDLMRHITDAPAGVMDFLFVELILWARSQGFAWFNLGMAPLSGFAHHPLAPTWHKIGSQIALRGSRYYSFAGLRAFKAKFDPEWTPRYLAAPPAALAAAILDATRLVTRPAPVRLTNS